MIYNPIVENDKCFSLNVVSSGCNGNACSIDKMYGKSLVFNQLSNYKSGTSCGIVITSNGNGGINLHGEAAGVDQWGQIPITEGIPFHRDNRKYLLYFVNNGNYKIGIMGYDDWTTPQIWSATAEGDWNVNIFVRGSDGDTINIDNLYINVFDLRLMGIENEINTVSDFEKLFPLPYYDYNSGTVLNNKAEKLETIGFNIWDEIWENGTVSYSDGHWENKSNSIGTKKYYHIFPSTSYYIKCSSYSRDSNVAISFYDADKNFISSIITMGGEITTPANTYYIRFYWEQTDSPAIYRNDFCINLSNPSRNGTYKPYKRSVADINITSVTGKLNGEGPSVVIFPDGMKSAGDVYDEIVGNKAIKRVGTIDLGTLSWNSGYLDGYNTVLCNNVPGVVQRQGGVGSICNAYLSATWGEMARENTDKMFFVGDSSLGINAIGVKDKSITSGDIVNGKIAKFNGVYAYYELPTPEVYVLDKPFAPTAKSTALGMQKVLPENTSTPTTGPIRCDMKYA